MHDEVKKAFPLRSMVSFRSARKFSSYLVQAKLYHVEKKVGSYKCNCNWSRCKSIFETDTFACSNYGTTYKINHKFGCNVKWLIHLISCKNCFKQYVGQMVDTLRSCCNNYKDNVSKYERGQQCMQKHLY